MQKVIYQALLSAPVRVGGMLSGIAGFVGSVWPAKVKSVIGQGIPVQPIAIALLAIAVVYFLLLWLLKPGERGGEGGVTQTTLGPNSPNMTGTFHGPVTQTFHAPPPDNPPDKSPHRSWTDESLAGLQRAMGGGSGPTGISSLRPGLATYKSDDRCPEMPIWQAIQKIAARIGDGDSANRFPEARRQLRQAALEGSLIVWGREQIPPAGLQDNRCRDVLVPIRNVAYWNDYRIKPEAALESEQDGPHTEEEELPSRLTGRFWSLKVDPKKIDDRWRKPAPQQSSPIEIPSLALTRKPK